ncbi:M3 family oligoendopeptidase [Microbaculum marinisediminis]|uniref:M3 family oligoendopeptidase n=1 Tax=Microbaculum marinisediminis TaxID=2931392 RepID=A0AAW5QZI3_9HYPH|nr:M3 family oligoendopeptidase [Microbaculum sp. A6E488]MCT8971675.1 M3 family oligoendopeptidase [Microbaculum sp. A6E488]
MKVRNAATGAQASTKIDLGPLPAWNLDDLYPGMESPEVRADLDRSLKDSEAFEAKWKSTLADLLERPDGAKSLADAIAEFEVLQDVLGRLVSYAGLQHALDVSDPKRSKFFGDVREKVTNAGIHLLFFPLELNRLDDAKIEAAMQSEPALDHYRPWIEDERKERPYQLDDQLERLFHEKSITGRGAWNRLFDETMAALRFDVDGEELTLEPTLNLLQDSDGEKRRTAAQALIATFGDHLPTFSLVTNTLAKDKEISDRWRGFEDVADARHLANRVEREVVDALVESVRGAYPELSHRYYKLKAGWFGKDVLDFWDRNAPLPRIEQKTYVWSEARETVLSAYSAFSPDMAKLAEPFFDKGWIDAAVKPGKAPGAFAHPTVPSAHPYVLLNYLGRPRDVMTLAHELGHGVHQVLAAPQGPLMAPTPLTLAETASVFGEMLTFKALLAKTTDATARKGLLASKVEDMINTVVRQIAFYVFERRIHTARREGELTVDDINAIWKEVQAESLGPAIRLGEGYETFWCYVPHFIHSPFYVYAYAFGDCLVNSLYAIYENASDGFVAKYFDMLRAGGTKHHSELLAPFGLDARDPEFWRIGLKVISGLIDELEAMED